MPPSPIDDDPDSGELDLSRRSFLGGAARFGLAAAVGGASLADFLAACAPASQGSSIVTPKSGGHVLEAYPSDIRTMNPWNVGESASGTVCGLIHDGLLNVAGDGSLVPALASAVPTPSSDNTIVFQLRDGLKWSDGSPLTAEDVAFTYNLLTDPAFSAYQYQGRSNVTRALASVSAPDARTVMMKLKTTSASFLSTYCYQGILPKRVLGGLSGSQLNGSDFFNAPSVTSGPFKFVSWKKGQQVTMDRNPNYWKPVRLDGYVFVIASDLQSIGPRLKTGEIDVGTIDVSQLSDLKSTSSLKIFPYAASNVWTVFYQLNPNRPSYKLFSDKAVRQALRLAIDVPGIINAVFSGQAKMANSPFTSTTWAYDPTIGTNLTYNKSKAEQILDGAGWKKGGNGIRSKDGVPMAFGLLSANINSFYNGIVQVVLQNWKELGCDVTPKIGAIQSVIGQAIGQHDFDTFLIPFLNLGDPDGQTAQWDGANKGPGGIGLSGYDNNEVNQLIEQARSTYDQKQRKALYGKIQQIVLDDAPAAWLVYAYSDAAVNNRVQGFSWSASVFSGRRPWINDVWVTDGK